MEYKTELEREDEDWDLEKQSLLANAKGVATATGPYTYRENPEKERWPGEFITEKQLRRGFLRKVYGILAVQLAVTVGIVCLFLEDRELTDYVKKNPYVLICSLVTYLVLSLALICCGELRRKHPHGLICLGLVTLSLSVLVGSICATYTTMSVLYAGVITAGAFLGLTIYACQSKYDFTVYGGALCSMCMVLFMTCICMWLFPSEKSTISFVYAGFGSIVMCFFIVYDTQLMLGGTHKVAIGLDESVFAALNMYLDIINLFLYILQLMGSRR